MSRGETGNAGLPRRLGAILYDSLLVLALMYVASVPLVIVNGGEAVSPAAIWYQIYLLLVAWAFFVGFWTTRGRTLGMQTWRLRLETADGRTPGIASASLRFFGAIVSWLPLGLGFWWSLVDRERCTWHDRLSGTRLLRQN